MAALPATFRDAIAVTRSLGYQYLWIDSLCIIQDDRHDWGVEAEQMASIYKNGALTLAAAAAAAAAGPHCGLFPTETPGVFDAPLDLESFRYTFGYLSAFANICFSRSVILDFSAHSAAAESRGRRR